ncbi:MAG: class I SAM-dependent methyltransferase [Bacteroidales bacterium]|jgi:SAM-dependent methyltransferase|nr:class I SAM-dependent methyltransferase [Bacteroidales bacterium]
MALNKRYEKGRAGIEKLNEFQKNLKKTVELKIRNGEYSFEELMSCPSCRGKKFETLSEVDRYGFEISTVICMECGLIFANPRFNQESYIKFYDSEYRCLYSSSAMATEVFWANQKKQGKKIFDYLSKIREIKNLDIAEIGVGAGGILKYFQEKENNVAGVDFGQEYLSYGKKNGLNLIQGGIDELAKKKLKFDLVIYSHVFEHILDLEKELKSVKKILRKDGILYIEVPGVKNLDRSYEMDFLKSLQNAHVYYFTLNSLKNILSRNGFSLIRGDEFVHAAFKISECKGEKIPEYDSTVNYLNKKEIQRKKVFPNYYVFKTRIKERLAVLLKAIGVYNLLYNFYRIL